MRLLELFAGSRSIGSEAEKQGFEVFSVDWTEYENKWIYGIESVDVKKSVELENKLYEKIKTLHNNV